MIEIRHRFNNGNGGASLVASQEITTGRLGMGGVEETEIVQVSEFLDPAECIRVVLELLDGNVKPGALSVIKDLIRENSYGVRVVTTVKR